jgi:ribonuclease P protein component
MLPRENRLTGKRSVARVNQKGERLSGRLLSVRLLSHRGKHPRAAVVVSTAVSKKATERNRAKRIVRALLARCRLPQADLVVFVRRLPSEGNWSDAFTKELSQWFPGR